MTPEATVLIVTRNRCAELRLAVQSALRQGCAPEVLVIDDASNDDTPAMLARHFPTVRVHRSEEPRGYVAQRNLGVRLAATPIVVSLDDDAVLASPETVAQTLREFDHPQIGAVAIPYVENGRAHQRAPSRTGVFVTSEFVGCAFAVRRDTFLRLGGFREAIVHQGEERDFCMRLLDAGALVRSGRADPIVHRPSPARDLRRVDLYGRRNAILAAWWNEPFPAVAVRIAEMTAVGLVNGIRAGRLGNAIRGVLLGYRSCWDERSRRQPVARPVSRAFRRLWKVGPLPLSEIERVAPAISTEGTSTAASPGG